MCAHLLDLPKLRNPGSAPGRSLEPAAPRSAGAGRRQQSPGNALFVGAGGGPGAVTQAGVMRRARCPAAWRAARALRPGWRPGPE